MSEPFRALFLAHSAFVWRVLQRHGVPARELEDACQDVFMVVHRRLHEFDGRFAIRAWLYGIAVRVAWGMRRRAHVRREQLDDELPEASPETHTAEGAFEHLERRQLLRLAERALNEMAEEKREVFALYELEGLTMAEVAASMEIPERTALSRLYAAREEIQRFIRAQQGNQQRKAYAEAKRLGAPEASRGDRNG